MALIDKIPMPGTGFEGMQEGSDWMNKLLMAPAERREKLAKATQEEALAKLPFGGHFFPGVAGQLQGLEAVKMMYGEGSPQYKQAKSMLDLEQQSTQSRINYQNILANTAPKRSSTNLAKTAQEFEDIKQGYLPGTKIPLNDEQRKQYEGMYGLDFIKKTTDSDTRKRNLFANNIEVTQSKIDPVALTQYSGLKGATQLLKDRADSASGKPSERYKNYEKSLTAAKMLAKQIRQFYGDSITPGVQEGLKQLTNPSSWMKDPDIALSNYNAFTDLLNQEMSTYRQATESPDVYTGKGNERPINAGQPQQQPVVNQPENTNPPAPNVVTGKDGKPVIVMYKGKQRYEFPANYLNHPKLKDYTLEPT